MTVRRRETGPRKRLGPPGRSSEAPVRRAGPRPCSEREVTVVRLAIIACWAASFCALSYGAKILVMRIPPLGNGVSALARHLLLSGWTYLIFMLYGCCAVLYLAALRKMPLSIAGPVFLLLGSVLSLLLGVALLKESLSASQGVGCALCLAGIALMYWN